MGCRGHTPSLALALGALRANVRFLTPEAFGPCENFETVPLRGCRTYPEQRMPGAYKATYPALQEPQKQLVYFLPKVTHSYNMRPSTALAYVTLLAEPIVFAYPYYDDHVYERGLDIEQISAIQARDILDALYAAVDRRALASGQSFDELAARGPIATPDPKHKIPRKAVPPPPQPEQGGSSGGLKRSPAFRRKDSQPPPLLQVPETSPGPRRPLSIVGTPPPSPVSPLTPGSVLPPQSGPSVKDRLPFYEQPKGR
ncbi:hypothetical protein Hypma_008194 [Hypsizygus marmoreus]|uniref:Uncharacterized protein n=1 Tax=Hypsizygus marmoreus TaxID=39966 RepID=A0A369JVJ1_HYPMA|nr:hypothetical protein Hypma_008194 [Hypsizygus marmoreus]